MCSCLLLCWPWSSQEARASAPVAQINCLCSCSGKGPKASGVLWRKHCLLAYTTNFFSPTTVSIEYITMQKHSVFIHAAITPQHRCSTFQPLLPCFQTRDPGRIFLRFLACHSPRTLFNECFVPNFQSKLLVARSQRRSY